jgi:hypothetical protein
MGHLIGPGRAGPVCRILDGGGGAEAPISTPPGGARRRSTPPRASANPDPEGSGGADALVVWAASGPPYWGLVR